MKNTSISYGASFRLFCLFSCLTLQVACSEDNPSDDLSAGNANITGTVTYRERMLLPSDAIITITVEDVSLQDVPSVRIAETSFAAVNSPPYPFSLNYDPSLLQNNHRYNLRVRIVADNQLMFMNTTAVPAFAQNPVEIVVTRVSGQSMAMQPDASVTNTFWQVISLYGSPAPTGDNAQAANMVLNNESVQGFAGCNRFNGNYSLDADTLDFGPMMATLMACQEGEDLERLLFQALEETDHFTVYGPVLSLYAEDERIIAQFEAVYL